ncbi:hypothetical protein RCL_jg7822.t1 [Rhizophagus clarus]|uniref:Uncharacterized protein n=1 Tax=Rhizophagus clarus TaxID=94130 RepID=A0A8H3R5Q7_9GLOM|nr:hypothetical protein RCL_jg7822.t1 [Rhizophagus clarus]
MNFYHQRAERPYKKRREGKGDERRKKLGRKRKKVAERTPRLEMLPDFLDELDLRNVTSLLERTGFENIS